jgi:glyoxylase-like metal-dependent hydrolase (beta-lactamase superfamily II)
MHDPDELTRRTFLVRAGQGSIALAVLGAAGCGPTAFAAGPEATPASGGGGGSASDGGTSPVTWHRADLGYVSAYVLVRSGEAAVVDTGLPDSERSIEAALREAGLGWDAVGHVVLTHRHGDHVGSLDSVLANAPDATPYAGPIDIPKITSPRPIRAVGDGDRVFGLRIIATPGHTLGHISALDEAGGLLVAGDALSTSDGKVGDSNPDYTDDMDQAIASIRKLGGLRYETLLVGHGDPILSGASAQVAAFAAAG